MRKHYLDNIRWVTVILVLFYHVFYMFNHVGVFGGIKPLENTELADSFLYLVYPWFMVLLFLIAGISSRYSLMHRSDKQFLSERVTKLLVPSTLGLFIYHWIGGYLNVKLGGGLAEIPSFIRFPIFVLTGTGPLWFIQMLFLFSIVLVLIRKFSFTEKLWGLCEKVNLPIIILFVLPLWGSSFLFNLPVITTYRFGIYLFAFLLGYFVFSHETVTDKLVMIKIPLLLVAIVMGVGYTIYYFGKSYVSDECLHSLFTNAYAWITILAFLGCSKAWFNQSSPFTEYMTRVSFGWYIMHYPILLIVCNILLLYFNLPSVVIYILTLVIYIPLTALLFEVFKRIPFVRFLVLGIKNKKQPVTKQ